MNQPWENDRLVSTEKKLGDNDVAVIVLANGTGGGGGRNHNTDHRVVDWEWLYSQALLFLSQLVHSISLFNEVTYPHQGRTSRPWRTILYFQWWLRIERTFLEAQFQFPPLSNDSCSICSSKPTEGEHYSLEWVTPMMSLFFFSDMALWSCTQEIPQRNSMYMLAIFLLISFPST